MAQARRRTRGSIETLRSGSLRVSVYAGIDPVTKRRMYLKETVPAGPGAAKRAEKARTRMQNQVDEKRNPRTRATLRQLVERWLSMHRGARSTVRSYESKAHKHIYPLIGDEPLARIDTEVLDSFYAELRRCREHCDGKPRTQHRAEGQHVCDEHKGSSCDPADPQHCRACRRRCKPHVCRGLGNSTIRQIHWIISGALDRGVMWNWLSVNPAEYADKPALPHPEPRPPSADEAKRLIEEAWHLDSDWGAFIWTKMTIGARRGEMCALHWSDVDLDRRTITIRRALDGGDRTTPEKDTKAHQQRRLVLDPETVQVLTDLQWRARDRLSRLGLSLPRDAYVFSPVPDGSQPLKPDTASQRYRRMAERLGIDTTLKNLRHYSATELINAGVNVRTVAGRLGHGGGGATTLRVYTAWSSEADQRAVGDVSARMPARPEVDRSSSEPPETGSDAHEIQAASPHLRIASALRGAIESGVLSAGDRLPSEKSLAQRYGVANSTAHRAVSLLANEGLAEVRIGRGTYVLP